MKKLFTLITFILMTGIVSAQYIYTDFDDNQNVEFTGWPNVPVAIANPDPSGINTSANVGEWMRSSEQWAHVYTDLDEKINFNTGTTFSMKIWSPIACEVLFKLEDKTNAGTFMEIPQSVETPNEWVELSFDFTGAASDTYDKVVIFMDFATTTENTFYFDDIAGPEFGAGGGPTGAFIYNDADDNQNVEVNGWPNIPVIIDNPDPSGINTSAGVGQWERTEEQWAHMYLLLDGKIDFTTGEKFYLKAWSPIACEVLFKLEDQNDPGIFVEIPQNIDTPNEWVQLEFDFTGSPSDTYDKIVVFMDFATTTNNTFYVDDLQGPEYAMGGGPTGAYVYNDADNNQNEELMGWPNVPAIITNPDQSGLNTSAGVAEWQRSEEMWAHVWMDLNGKVDFSTGEHFYLKAWSPIACEVLFKLEDQNDPNTFVEVSQNIETANEWVQLEFDFTGAASDTYDKIVIFMDFTSTTANTFYIDDIQGPEYVSAGVNDNLFSAAELYPNPAAEQIHVKGVQLIKKTEIFNTAGQLVIRQEGMQEAIDISGLQPGLYTVLIEDQKGELYLSKLIKK